MSATTINILLTSLFVFISILLFGCTFDTKPYSKDLSRINAKTCKDLKSLFNMDCAGGGLGLDHSDPEKRIKDIYIECDLKREVDLNEARNIAVQSLQIVYHNIIENSDFSESFLISDFNESNIDMSIIFLTQNGERTIDPVIAVVTIHNSQLYFRTNNPENPFRYKTEITETLEEARKKVSN